MGADPEPVASGALVGRRSPATAGSPATATAGHAAPAASSASDVAADRERSRQVRLRRLALVLAVVAGILWWRLLVGHPLSLASLRVPSGAATWGPAAVLVLLLGAVLAVPLLGAGRSPHVLYRPGDVDVTLDDVKGAGVVVDEVVRTLELFLSHRRFHDSMGGTPRRAILFEGPPGTGKTYLAKAMAAEAGVPFLFVSSSAFQSMYYGQTNRKIRSFFKALRRFARSEGGAVGFIEEIDAIGASRSGMGGSGQREGVTGVVNELLVQLQSFDQPPPGARLRTLAVDLVNRWLPTNRQLRRPRHPAANVLVVGATNRADDLDPALLRPGRFDRSIHFDLPTRSGRREIIDHYLGRKAHDAGLDDPKRRDALAAMTFGYSPVMIEHLLDEALVWALRRRAGAMSWADITRAKMTEEIGLAQPVEYAEAERRTIATHESGHAAVAWLVGRGRRLEVLSIIKRRDALGLLAHSDAEERFTRTRSELQALVQIAMGGLVAEELFFGETSSGVSGDLAAATGAAAQMVGSFGMAGSLVSYEATGPGGPSLVTKVLSDEAGRAAVEALLEGAKEEVRRLLTTQRHLVEALRDALLDREELVGDEITDVITAARPEVIDLRSAPSARPAGTFGPD
ncbi:MAG: AAA family ATPase [Acidimicrobiales bacterium]